MMIYTFDYRVCIFLILWTVRGLWEFIGRDRLRFTNQQINVVRGQIVYLLFKQLQLLFRSFMLLVVILVPPRTCTRP